MANWHIPELTELEKKFNTDLSDGLSAREASIRLDKEYKRDKKGRKKSLFVPNRRSMWIYLASFTGTPFVILLLVMSLLTAFFGKPLLGASVFVLTIASAIFGGIVSLRAQRRLDVMKEYASPMIRVKRGGNLYHTDGRNVVVGDVVYLSAGDLVPCDARIIKCEAFFVDELIAKKDGLARRRVIKNSEVIYDAETVSGIIAENMVYAGSAVVGGSAVALVVATGSDVYLSEYVPDGALGGKDTESEAVRTLKPIFIKSSFICVAAVLLLSLLGLLTLNGKEIFVCYFTMLLSAVFLIGFELMNFGTREIFSSYITRLSRTKSEKRKRDNSACIRNVKALDTLTGVSELMLFGTAGLYMGSYRISSAYVSGNVIDKLTPEAEREIEFLNYVHTYVKAHRDSSVETSFGGDGLTEALYQHLRSCGFDISGASLALKSLYFVTDSKTGYGFACAETNDSIYRTALSYDENIVKLCKYIRDTDGEREINSGDIKSIRSFSSISDQKNERCLFCISERDGRICFEGAISVYQPIDTEAGKVVKDLTSFGIKTTVILQKEDDRSSKTIATSEFSPFFSGRVAYASEFHKEKKNIWDGLGSYCAYVGFNKSEISDLMTAMKSRGAKIAAYGISNDFNDVMVNADIVITSDVIRYSSDKYRESVYERLPAEGKDTNVRASQQTRLLSKVIVKRSHEKGGGIYSIFKAIRMARGAYVSIAQSFLLFTFLMSGLLTFSAMSVITGNMLLNPVQTIAISGVIGFLTTTVFSDSEQTLNVLAQKRNYTLYPLRLVLSGLPGIIARASAAFITAIVVKILDIVGIFGENPNYTLPIFVSLILTTFVEVFFINYEFTKKGQGRNYSWLKVMIAYAILLGICAISTQYPFDAEFYPNGFGQLEYAIVPCYVILYFIGVGIAKLISNRRKKD